MRYWKLSPNVLFEGTEDASVARMCVELIPTLYVNFDEARGRSLILEYPEGIAADGSKAI